MKSLKIQIGSLALIAACLMMPVQSMAQWSIGASYEIRNEAPKKGFGVRLERSILNPIPIIDIRLRAHFSSFSDNNSNFSDNGTDYSGDPSYYDYGLAATGGVSLGLLKPYIGLGIGNGHYNFDGDIDSQDFDDNSFFWSSFVGVSLAPVPIIKPFVEYRFEPTDEADFAPSSNGRLVLGLSLSL